MALHIRSDQVDTLARKVAEKTGETLTDAIKTALAERLARLESVDRNAEEAMLRDILEIASRMSPEFRNDKRTSREMIDELYDEDGLPR
jgi:antitoxin VapB